MTYRTDLPMMALAKSEDNRQSAVTIAAGESVTVVGPADDPRFLIVLVNDTQFHVFASDLTRKGKQVEAIAS